MNRFDPLQRRHYNFRVVVIGICSVALLGGVATGKADDGQSAALRVCADANNLPFSNREQAGFENKLAQIVAAGLGKRVAFVWQPQRRGFVRRSLVSGACDALMGVPRKLDRVETTHPYYRSTYVFLHRAGRYEDLQSIKDPRLRSLSVGVQLIGDDGYNTPPAHALSAQGIVDNIVGYTIYGDYREANPPSRIVEAVAHGDIDVAAVWGPLAGYFARQSPVPLAFSPIIDTADFDPLLFQYDISIGVRKGDDGLRTEIDAVLVQHRDEIARLLRDYAVPVVDRDVRLGNEN